jgi:hypothetical protein
MACGRALRPHFWLFSPMFNFSANRLLLLSRTEYRSCAVFLMIDDSTRRVYRLYDFTKSQLVTPGQPYCVYGKVNSADKLYLVIESVRPDRKSGRPSNTPAPADGAGGSAME